MNWKYYCAACLVVGAALLKSGAPALAVLAGAVLAAMIGIYRHRSANAPKAPGKVRRRVVNS